MARLVPRIEDLRRPSALVIIAANALSLAAAIALAWDVGTIMVLFWMENLVIGLFAAARIALVARSGALVLVPFFSLHYGLFCYVHGLFVVVLFLGRGADGLTAQRGLATLLEMAPVVAPGVLLLLASHGASFVLNFLLGGELSRARASIAAWTKMRSLTPRWEAQVFRGDERAPPAARDLMVAPYRRVFVFQLTLIVCGILLAFVDARAAGLLVLVAIKTVVDLAAHAEERRKATSFEIVAVR